MVLLKKMLKLVKQLMICVRLLNIGNIKIWFWLAKKLEGKFSYLELGTETIILLFLSPLIGQQKNIQFYSYLGT